MLVCCQNLTRATGRREKCKRSIPVIPSESCKLIDSDMFGSFSNAAIHSTLHTSQFRLMIRE
jgi:hypothetical protein